MQINGKVVKVFPPQTGEGKNGNWIKRAFVLETDGQYPKKVQISAFGDKMNVNLIKEGNELNVSFDLESREYNDKWYTDVKAFAIHLINENPFAK